MKTVTLSYHFGKVGGGWLIPKDMPFMKEFLNLVDSIVNNTEK